MLVAVDVHYAEYAVATAAVGFADWPDPAPAFEFVLHTDTAPAPYQPGAFYLRELPFLLEAIDLAQRRHAVEVVVVDAHVRLREGQPGLGARLYEALGAHPAVVGVAKTAFAGGSAVLVFRGDSRRPLFVTAAGMDTHQAAELIRAMYGPHRLPTLLKRADHLARGQET